MDTGKMLTTEPPPRLAQTFRGMQGTTPFRHQLRLAPFLSSSRRVILPLPPLYTPPSADMYQRSVRATLHARRRGGGGEAVGGHSEGLHHFAWQVQVGGIKGTPLDSTTPVKLRHFLSGYWSCVPAKPPSYHLLPFVLGVCLPACSFPCSLPRLAARLPLCPLCRLPQVRLSFCIIGLQANTWAFGRTGGSWRY